MIPDLPDCCPLGSDGSPCRIQKHSKRHRKAGPGYSLVVVHCALHRRFYTLYPLGFVPYRRSRIAPVGEDGRISVLTDAGLSGWENTLFEVVAEAETASSANRGPVLAALEPGTRQQRRQLYVAASVLGLMGSVQRAELAAVDLEVDLQVLTSAREAVAVARGVKQLARAIAPLLAALPRSGPLLLRLLRAGTRAGVWGGAWWWAAGTGYARSFQRWERR